MRKILFFGMLLAVPFNVFAAAGHELDWKTFFWRVAMFVVFISLLYFFTAKPIRNMLSKRTDEIKAALAEAESAKDAAVAQKKEYEAKIAELNKELEQMKVNALRVAEAERKHMIEDAERYIEQMKQFAVTTIQAETERARVELRKEIVDLAVAEAEKKLTADMKGDKSSKVLEEYVKHIGE